MLKRHSFLHIQNAKVMCKQIHVYDNILVSKRPYLLFILYFLFVLSFIVWEHFSTILCFLFLMNSFIEEWMNEWICLSVDRLIDFASDYGQHYFSLSFTYTEQRSCDHTFLYLCIQENTLECCRNNVCTVPICFYKTKLVQLKYILHQFKTTHELQNTISIIYVSDKSSCSLPD